MEIIINWIINLFSETRVFSHMICLNHIFLPQLLLVSLTSFRLIHFPSFSYSENIKPRRDKQSNRTKQDIIRQGKYLHMKAEQGSPIGWKEFQEQVKKIRDETTQPWLGVPPNLQGSSYNIYSEDLVLTHESPLLVISVSVNPFDP